MGTPLQIDELLAKHALFQPMTIEEQEWLQAWRKQSEWHAKIFAKFSDPEWVADHRKKLHEAPTAEIWVKLLQRIDEGVTGRD